MFLYIYVPGLRSEMVGNGSEGVEELRLELCLRNQQTHVDLKKKCVIEKQFIGSVCQSVFHRVKTDRHKIFIIVKLFQVENLFRT